MANIELVIKIPEHYYENNIMNDLPMYLTEDNIIAILPKGHGVLKDMGNLQYVFDLTREDPIYSGKDIERAIKSMKSIIEADTESEVEE